MDQLALDSIRILILINQQVLKTLLIEAAELLIFLQQLKRKDQ